jgi:hypothetical protein
MSSRFASNLIVCSLAAFLAVASFAFPPGTLAWLSFGVACAVTLTVLAAFAFRGRGPAQRVLDLLSALIGGWTIVASLLYQGGLLKWLSVGAAGALWGLAVTGLVLHEVSLRTAVRRTAELPRSGSAQATLREQRPLTAA